MPVEKEKSQVLRRGIPFGRIGEVASTDKSTIWPSDVSSYYGGRDIASDKAQRIREAAAKLIDLHDSVLVAPNWRSPVAVRAALAKLTEIRATESEPTRNIATAPWQKVSTSAVAPYEPDTDLASSASGILAGAERTS